MAFSPSEISAWFWDIISNAGSDQQKLRRILARLSREELIRFEDEFSEASAQLRDDPFTRYVEGGDASEDAIEDAANLVVSLGRETFELVWTDPSLMPTHVDVGDPRILSGVADSVHYDRFGEPIRFPRDHVFTPYA